MSFTVLNSFVLSLSREKGHCSLKAVFMYFCLDTEVPRNQELRNSLAELPRSNFHKPRNSLHVFANCIFVTVQHSTSGQILSSITHYHCRKNCCRLQGYEKASIHLLLLPIGVLSCLSENFPTRALTGKQKPPIARAFLYNIGQNFFEILQAHPRTIRELKTQSGGHFQERKDIAP